MFNELIDKFLTSEGRRAAAIIFMAAGGAVMTAYAFVALWMVASIPAYVFWLGLASHVSVLTILTGFAGLLVKRMLKAGVGTAMIEINDSVKKDDEDTSGN